MVKEDVNKKTKDMKLLDVRIKIKEKKKARRKRKRQQHWSNLGTNEKAQKDNKTDNIDPHKKQMTFVQDEGTAAASTYYSSTKDIVNKVQKDAMKKNYIFEKKSGAVNLKKREEKKARRKNKLQQNWSSIGSHEMICNDKSEKEIVPRKTYDLDTDVQKVKKEGELEMNEICGMKNRKLEKIKLKKKAKNKVRRKNMQDLATKLKTSMQTKGMHEETDGTCITDTKDDTVITGTKDDLEEVKKIKEIGGENIYLKNLMLVKRENNKAKRKTHQQKKAAKRFVGMKNSQSKENTLTKKKNI